MDVDSPLFDTVFRFVFSGVKSWKQLRCSRGLLHDSDDDDDDDDDALATMKYSHNNQL